MVGQEQKHIETQVEAEVDARAEQRRKAWRGLLIPAVGSAAFFTSTLLGVARTYRQYGWPSDAFGWTDYALMSIPFVILALGLTEEIKEAQG
ncbi:MAG: hypothetical protein CMN00_03000 [Rickettsiales bacterium]|nr:hypothetical protein [Rickettsiales bacterium]|tara:strand:- start:688 stop:963 length:276 start_codon:yes stop_codon:yes gene_type:complete